MFRLEVSECGEIRSPIHGRFTVCTVKFLHKRVQVITFFLMPVKNVPNGVKYVRAGHTLMD